MKRFAVLFLLIGCASPQQEEKQLKPHEIELNWTQGKIRFEEYKRKTKNGNEAAEIKKEAESRFNNLIGTEYEDSANIYLDSLKFYREKFLDEVFDI